MKPTAKSLTLLGAVLIVTAPLTIGTARADEHEEARRLREAGDILPLEEVIARVRAEHPGRIIETELESEGGRYVYEIEVLEESGEVTEFKIDARSGERIRYEDRDRDWRTRSEDRED
ncbi:MAG: peptidase M4 [Gammaproteobacteria bacterium]|nr:peptidase M4 [Gammaproteobacteria bacterium]NIR83474.1 peptidase M4 [Gammaproteobacteria bacterium]NIR91396.1 peptidase M4 [Gammaproteobacteria bacterium]NIU04636.1 peptidase M4 [Gammaproteobacteria bacterium]NIV51678.1 peptidase M4 [Gammaproteobacteria bacterium]